MSTSQYSAAYLATNTSPRLVGVTAAFLTFSVVSVALRLYVRIFMSKAFGSDDVMTILALLFYMMYSGAVFAGAHYGTGRHLAALTPYEFSHAMKAWYIAEIFYAISSTLVRVSVGMLLLRLTTIRWHRYIIYVIMTISVVSGIALFFVCVFQCSPVSFYWSYGRVTGSNIGHCLDGNVVSAFVYAHGAVACLGDWTLGILPWFLVNRLNMNTRTKVSVGLLLCLANFGSISMVIRFYSVKQIAATSDFLYETIGLALWSSIEVGTGIPASSLVTLRPLFKSFFGSSRGNPSSGPAGMPSTSRFRGGSGYIRQNTNRTDGQHTNIELKGGTLGGHMKGTVTTTVIGNANQKHQWNKNKNDSTGNLSSDEEPLHIRKDYDVKVNYSQNSAEDM